MKSPLSILALHKGEYNMPKGDKYIGLTNYLRDKSDSSIIMSFSEIEIQVGNTLPASAHKRRAFGPILLLILLLLVG